MRWADVARDFDLIDYLFSAHSNTVAAVTSAAEQLTTAPPVKIDENRASICCATRGYIDIPFEYY